MPRISEWFFSLSVGKFLAVSVVMLIFLDMACYYIGAFFGRTTPPYPILFEFMQLLKEIHIGG